MRFINWPATYFFASNLQLGRSKLAYGGTGTKPVSGENKESHKIMDVHKPVDLRPEVNLANNVPDVPSAL